MPNKTKVALVTGASRRIGAAIVKKLHSLNFNVIIHYRHSQQEAVALKNSLNQQRQNSAECLAADLSDVVSAKQLISEAVAVWGRLDVLVNNASTFYPTTMGKITEAQWNELFTSNCKTPFFLMQQAFPELVNSNGCVVNITDIHSDFPSQDFSVYCAAKAALASLTKACANEFAPNVRVNGIAPGAILWPEGKAAFDDIKKQRDLARIPLAHIGKAEDIADTVAFLVSHSYITGQIIAVDGGKTSNFSNS